MIFPFLIALVIGFEIQNLIQFNLFFRLKCIVADYYLKVLGKVNSVAYKELVKISGINFVYLVICVIGLFTINLYFFVAILFLSLVIPLLLKKFKNKSVRKVIFTFDILISILLLTLSLINIYFYHLDSISFIKQLLNI